MPPPPQAGPAAPHPLLCPVAADVAGEHHLLLGDAVAVPEGPLQGAQVAPVLHGRPAGRAAALGDGRRPREAGRAPGEGRGRLGDVEGSKDRGEWRVSGRLTTLTAGTRFVEVSPKHSGFLDCLGMARRSEHRADRLA